MNLEQMIKAWLLEGKSVDEIADLIAALPGDDTKSLSPTEIAQKIFDLKKTSEVAEALKALAKSDQDKEAKKSAETATQKAISDAVDAKLKSISIDPTGRYRDSAYRNLKRFDVRSGQYIEQKVTEGYGVFNEMLKCFMAKDLKEAAALSLSIDKDNDLLEGKQTPSVSDVGNRGGYAVPTEVSDTIMQLFYQQSALYSLMNKDSIMFNSKVYPLFYGLTVVDIADQSTALTEKNPTFANPTINMYRAGAFSAISNLLIAQKGADITGAFAAGYAAAFAEFFDYRSTIGNVTGGGALGDGIVFDANTNLPTPFARASLTLTNLETLKNTLSSKASLASTVFIANRLVSGQIGLLENTAGNYVFPEYVSGGKVAPLGIPLITVPAITSVLNVGGDNDTGGTDDVLIVADLSKVVTGVSMETRIDTSEHFYFSSDQMAIRGVKNFGQKVMSSSSTGGIVAIAQELTN